MCGRFNLSYTTSDLSAQLPHVLWDFEQIPSFNIAPSHQISVISEMAGEFRGSRMQWGIPVTENCTGTLGSSSTLCLAIVTSFISEEISSKTGAS